MKFMHAGPIVSRFATHEDDEPVECFAPTTHGRKRVDDHARISRIETLGLDDRRSCGYGSPLMR